VSEHEAFETIGDPDSAATVVFTCEHASRALPEWTPTPEDRPLLDDHWGWDVGAADLTRALVEALGGVAVLSRFSRLVCDPNREPEDPTFVVECIGDHVLSWNRGIDATERARRRDRYYDPYHAEIDRVLAARGRAGRSTRLCAIHSFTPHFAGAARAMEVGVLFDAHETAAARLEDRIRDAGLRTAANEPYSGYAGLVHAARRHGRRHDIVYLEIEVRQDLIATRDDAARMAERLAPAIADYAAGATD